METRKKYDVVISGMGTAGLSVAVEALHAGKSVLIVNIRPDDFVRVQSVFITHPGRKYLIEMMNSLAEMSAADKEFKELLEKSLGIAIKEVERYIKRRLDEKPNPLLQIDFLYESQLSEVDFDAGLAKVKALNGSFEHQIEFTYLIGADGYKHHAANVLNAGEHNPHIKFITSEEPGTPIVSPGNRQNAFLYAEMKRTDGQPFHLPVHQFLVFPGANLETKRDSFAYYVFYAMLDQNYKKLAEDPTKIKMGLGIELPAHVHQQLKLLPKQEDQAQVVIDYISPYFFERLQRDGVDTSQLKISMVKPSRKHGFFKDNLKFRYFETHLSGAEIVGFERNGKKFGLAGDAVRKPFFHISHGLNDALYEASMLGRVFRGVMDISQYNEKCLRRSKEVSDFTRELGTCYTDYERRWEQTGEVEKRVLCKFNSQEPAPESRLKT